ncbi:hypothetical protein ACQKWADRAFT_329371 [Trichoderma austrokoningii]
MVHFYKSLSGDLKTWALQQQMFFIASAPLNGQHVNLSPKGLTQSTFHIFDPNHAAYLDTVGSGVETISHLYENKRATLMFCSLDGKPRIMRLFCTGSVVEQTDSRFSKLMQSIGQKGEFPGIRAVIMLEIFKADLQNKVQTSCGYGVPILDRGTHSQHSEEELSVDCCCYKERPTLEKALHTMVRKGGVDAYIRETSKRSLDGLLGLREARKMSGEWLLVDDVTTWIGRQLTQGPAIALGIFIGLFIYTLVRSHIIYM